MLSVVSLGCTPVKSISSIGLFNLNGLMLEKLEAIGDRFHSKYQATGNRPGTGLCCGTVETSFWIQEQETGWFEWNSSPLRSRDLFCALLRRTFTQRLGTGVWYSILCPFKSFLVLHIGPCILRGLSKQPGSVWDPARLTPVCEPCHIYIGVHKPCTVPLATWDLHSLSLFQGV